MKSVFKQGACAVITAKKSPGQILVVGRVMGGVLTYSLPGGKREPNESTEITATRETYEETGIVIAPEETTPLYVGICAAVGETPYWVATYWAELEEFPSEFNPPEKDMKVFVIDMEEFKDNNAFPSYNYEVFAKLAQIKPRN